jgi:hypothetical protein
MFPRFSPEGNGSTFSEKIKDFWKSVSMTLGRPLEDAIELLTETFRECSISDWDGYGASPITTDAFAEARKFIELLPSSIKIPEILAEPTGEIAMEWRKENRRIFIISLGGRQRITYAGIFGSNKTHGTEYFEDTLPIGILNNIRRVYS